MSQLQPIRDRSAALCVSRVQMLLNRHPKFVLLESYKIETSNPKLDAKGTGFPSRQHASDRDLSTPANPTRQPLGSPSKWYHRLC